jgi:hypothetical protein
MLGRLSRPKALSCLGYFKFLLAAAIFIAAVGCKGKPQEGRISADSLDTTLVSALDSGIIERLAKRSIVPQQLTFEVFSPDSKYLAFALDSTVRFGPGDEMWSQELPSDWYAVRTRNILYLYDPLRDTLHQVAECEEVVNFYYEETSGPVQPERKDRFGALLWSPDSKKLLLLKDREADGVSEQDALIFTLGEEQPAFLDLFSVWRQLMKSYPGAKGTKVEDIGWLDALTIRLVFSVRGASTAPHYEFIFDVGTGKVVSTKELSST